MVDYYDLWHIKSCKEVFVPFSLYALSTVAFSLFVFSFSIQHISIFARYLIDKYCMPPKEKPIDRQARKIRKVLSKQFKRFEEDGDEPRQSFRIDREKDFCKDIQKFKEHTYLGRQFAETEGRALSEANESFNF